MRTVGGSAAEASDGGVGARGDKSGGVAPEGTARTGVKTASAAGQKWRAAEAVITGTDDNKIKGLLQTQAVFSLQVSLPGRFHVGDSLVLDKL